MSDNIRDAALKREVPPADLVECVNLENLLTEPDIDRMSKYVDTYYIPENRVRAQAILAAANTGRKDLLSLIESEIGIDDEARNKAARWAAEILKSQGKKGDVPSVLPSPTLRT